MPNSLKMFPEPENRLADLAKRLVENLRKHQAELMLQPDDKLTELLVDQMLQKLTPAEVYATHQSILVERGLLQQRQRIRKT